MKLLSIIIPIYNVEEYIEKCLNSIYNQKADENLFEVIAVIDGSPDNSIEIVKHFAKKHSNIIIIDKENGGVSSARNIGIEKAEGKYITFVDPDDTLYSNSLEGILQVVSNKKPDIIVLNSYKEIDKSEVYSWRNKLNEDEFYCGLEAYNKGYTRSAIWGVLYNTTFLKEKNLLFPLGIKNSEDAIFFLKCQINAKSIIFKDIDTYNVYTRPGSASQDISLEKIELWFKSLECIKEYKKSQCTNEIEKSMADGLTFAIISDITKHAIKQMKWEAISFLKKNNIKDYTPICRENIKRSSLFNKILKITLNKSQTAFFLISYLRYRNI